MGFRIWDMPEILRLPQILFLEQKWEPTTFLKVITHFLGGAQNLHLLLVLRSKGLYYSNLLPDVSQKKIHRIWGIPDNEIFSL